MKLLIFMIFILFATNFYAGEKQMIDDIADLITEINTVTSGRWDISADNDRIYLNSKKQFLGKQYLGCGPRIEKNSKQNYSMFFNFCKKIDPNQYKKILESNKKKCFLSLKLARAKVKNEEVKGRWMFDPKSEQEWRLYLQYDCARQKLDDMADYYYKRIGLRRNSYFHCYTAKNKNDKIYIEIKNDEKNIFALLKKYQTYDIPLVNGKKGNEQVYP